MSNPEHDLISDIGRFCADPLSFVRYAFPWGMGELDEAIGPHEWQTGVLRAIETHLKGAQRYQPLQLAVASGHGVGKSALVAWIVNWAMSTCDNCRVIVTANTGDQLTTKTVPEVSKWSRMALNQHWWKIGSESIRVKDPKYERTWRTDFLTWSLERTEAFAGLHNKGKRIVVIFDEASAIPDKIWEVTEGALTDENTEIIWVAFGNPTLNTGRFRECFGRYKHRWKTMQVDSRKVAGTNKAQIQKWIDDYGEDSDFCRIRVKGEFPRAGSKQFISSELVAEARRRNVPDDQVAQQWKVLSVDVARFGDDQTVIGLRQGKRLRVLERLRGWDTMQTAHRVMYWMKQETPRLTVVDGDGIGAGVVDRVKEDMQNWLRVNAPAEVLEFHGGLSSSDPDMYFNARAEMWGRMKGWLETADIPDDPEVEADLTGVQYGFSGKNQIQLEKKEDMKKRGLASPDIGDMAAMSFWGTPAGKTDAEMLRDRLLSIKDPFQRAIEQVGATLQREKKTDPSEEMFGANSVGPMWMED